MGELVGVSNPRTMVNDVMNNVPSRTDLVEVEISLQG